MQSDIQVGTILMKDWPLKMQLAGVQTEPCSGSWSVVNAPVGSALDRKINAAGWNFFFMAAEVKVMFLGALGARRIQRTLERILGKVKRRDFNGLEITQIVAKHFLGVPYTRCLGAFSPRPAELLLGCPPRPGGRPTPRLIAATKPKDI